MTAGHRRAAIAVGTLAVVGAALAFFARFGGHPDPARLAAVAQDDWRAGRLDRAEAALATLAKIRPLTTPERLLAGQVARQQGRPEAGLAALGGVGDDDPMAVDVALARGILALDAVRLVEAEAALGRAVALAPGRPEARRELIRLGALWKSPGLIDAQARALARSEHRLDFDEAALWTSGRPLDRPLAVDAEALARALAITPADRNSRLALVECLRRLGRLDDASEAATPLPEDDDARAARARLDLDRGDPEAASARLGDGPPGSAEVARLRGRLALARGDAAAAADDFRAALDAEPDARDARAGLAQALRLAGHRDEAAALRAIADRQDRLAWLVANAATPSGRRDLATLRAIGDACLDLGDRDRARAWYRLALALDPLDAVLQKALYELGRP